MRRAAGAHGTVEGYQQYLLVWSHRVSMASQEIHARATVEMQHQARAWAALLAEELCLEENAPAADNMDSQSLAFAAATFGEP